MLEMEKQKISPTDHTHNTEFIIPTSLMLVTAIYNYYKIKKKNDQKSKFHFQHFNKINSDFTS